MSVLTLYPIRDVVSELGRWPNALYVDDICLYISAKQVWMTSLFKMSPPTVYGRVNSVTVYGQGIYRSSSVTAYALLRIYTHGSWAESTQITLTTSATTYSYTWYSNPVTGQAWTFDEIIDLCAGVSLWKSSYTTADAFCDRVYVEVDVTPIGTTNIVTMRPNGVGDLSECTRSAGACNYECVDEDVANDDADYVQMGTSSNVWYTDLYHLSTAELKNILYVAEWIRVRQTMYSNTWLFRNVIKTHGEVFTVQENDYPNNDWHDICYIWRLNPYTNAQWTQEEINDLQAGVGLYGYAAYPPRCTQVYVQVLGYTPPAGSKAQLIGCMW